MTESLFDSHDALGLAGLVRTREVGAAELLDEAIERVESADDELNMIASRDYDYARARIAEGLPDGPFSGVPFLRKDEGSAIEGLVTTSGMSLFAGQRSAVTSTLAQRYLDAGLVIFGSTAVPPFCVTVDSARAPYGACRNPWDVGRTPGGSSSGAAAVVGAGVLPMAHGNDGGGSLRIPASWSGAFTVKPSRGRMPHGPVYTEGWMGFAVDGTITRSVRDCAAILDATMGIELGSRYDAPRPERSYLEETALDCSPKRIAVMTRTHSGEAFHPHHLDATQRTAELLSGLGHLVEEAAPALPIESLSQELYKTVAVDIAAFLDGYGAERGRPVHDDELETLVAMLRRRGQTVTGKEYAAINQLSMEVAYEYASFMTDYDVVVSPTMPEPPPPIGEIYRFEDDYDAFRRDQDRHINLTQVQNVTGQPAASVPLWWSPDGLPIGMMLVGRYGDESTLFSLSAQLESAQPWWHMRPDPGIRP